MHESSDDGEIVHPVSGNLTEVCERHYIAKGKLQPTETIGEDSGGTSSKFSSKTQFLAQSYAGEKIVGVRPFVRQSRVGDDGEVDTLPIPQPILAAGAKDSKGDGEMVDAKGEGRAHRPMSKAEQKT